MEVQLLTPPAESHRPPLSTHAPAGYSPRLAAGTEDGFGDGDGACAGMGCGIGGGDGGALI